MEKHLHIIALNVPYPADYGGVFDLFYKLPALQNQSIKIHLHCFDYGRGEQPELNKYCESVTYYKRSKHISLTLPYIVSSRNNKTLLSNLLLDNHPILMEGIHCTYLLNDKRFSRRKCFVRLHNIEFKYYHYLYKSSSSSILKKLYYLFESRLLKAYEKRIANKAVFLAINTEDEKYYRQNFNAGHIQTIPLFLEERNVQSQTGKGSYCIFHADLSVPENEKIALWLVNKVFNNNKPLYLAGKSPSQKIIKKAAAHKQVTLIANPLKPAMDKLIQEAHIIITPSFNATGIKVKLIESLFNGRFVITNSAATEGNDLRQLCNIAETVNQMQQSITALYEIEFTQAEIDKRSKILLKEFDNEANAKKIIDIIY